MHTRRDVIVLGSTGSVGTQALELVAANPDRFRIVGLAAGGGNPDLLARQVIDAGVPVVAVARTSAVQDVQLALYAEAQRRGWSSGDYALPRILAGPDAAADLARESCDVLLNAITGSVGLLPTIAALEAGTTLALANKESLIVGGPIVTGLAKPGQIVPVDSEHSAIAQCLRAGRAEEVRRLVLTASGGPFRGRTRDELETVTVEQAMQHPNFAMGPVITINSATLVNKGLELIEAQLLFDVPIERVDVVVHPQQQIHSMVEFVDGSTIAQASPPTMAIPIALGMGWPDRVVDAGESCDWTRASTWEFFPLDDEAFPAVRLARTAAAHGRTAPAVYNAANEVCVDAFVAGEIAFPAIADTVASVLGEHIAADRVPSEVARLNVEDVLSADAWARERATRTVTESR
ncbi:1-deoxy-D-xylulose-5-phosphate reductoisomerase [Solicola gregarius]|uniref:1-deoxy-D-xylulose 5-phosphate reductoisomerase n=1 Tax=Solicola gregarius TaxID=2908642 RepID=A0AA46TG07_9ACTN|nr:1-deoxy-D-xylulose-5-phosphate reductoisomerase [Solicola gregarius]UYM04460.1 1-deoxy-D-xylulose-5-phosphate reductoisomerase [Solicola gregarius]